MKTEVSSENQIYESFSPRTLPKLKGLGSIKCEEAPKEVRFEYEQDLLTFYMSLGDESCRKDVAFKTVVRDMRKYFK